MLSNKANILINLVYVMETKINLPLHGKVIKLNLTTDGIVDYNVEFEVDKYDVNNICANVCYEISLDNNTVTGLGQVQYDTLNKEYSMCCDGNTMYDTFKADLLSLFSVDDLYIEHHTYHVESDLYNDIENTLMDKLNEIVCKYAAKEIKIFGVTYD